MNVGTLLAIIFIYVIFIVISLYITDFKLKMAYWFVVGLATLTIMNIYLSVTYYISLRNEVGTPGVRGVKGDPGPSGDVGVCTFSESCGIQNCDDKIYALAAELYPTMTRDCISDPSKCDNIIDQEKAIPLNKQITQLISACETTKYAEPDFMRRIRPQLELLNSTGN